MSKVCGMQLDGAGNVGHVVSESGSQFSECHNALHEEDAPGMTVAGRAEGPQVWGCQQALLEEMSRQALKYRQADDRERWLAYLRAASP